MVVELIIEHARVRPNQTLGVIAMGIKHANAIEESLRNRLREDEALRDELEDFFDESKPEPFFAKNLERVQGDERDAIILSVGYGKNARGDLPYRFGPLLQEGGERRLNVAVTRAKSRMTLVASFTHHDMDPNKSSAEGVQLLRNYMEYVLSDGGSLGDQILDKPELNPFETDVRDHLIRRGIPIVPQYGSSGYWIDFAAQHPSKPGRFVLAIECDGATYHSSESARDRDRLRQEQLERLGWKFHRIWSGDWFSNKEVALGRTAAAYETAVREADSGASPSQSTRARQPEDAPMQTASAERSLPRNLPMPGSPITAYSDQMLLEVAMWAESDGLIRTQDEVVARMMDGLGFKRRGKNVVTRLAAAVERVRRNPGHGIR